MVTVVFVLGNPADTVNVALVCPCSTVTLGSLRSATFWLLVVRFTTTPPHGAWEARVTVPVAESPPLTVEGDRLRVESVVAGMALTVKTCDFDPALGILHNVTLCKRASAGPPPAKARVR
jgi:hypothetical protein